MQYLKLSLLLIALAIFIIACNQTSNTPVAKNEAPKTNQAATPAPATPVDETAVVTELYAKNCMICHKDSGKGGKVTIDGKSLNPIDLTSDKMKNRSDDKLVSQISEGSTDDGMPAFKGKLTDDQIKSIVKHVRSLQGK